MNSSDDDVEFWDDEEPPESEFAADFDYFDAFGEEATTAVHLPSGGYLVLSGPSAGLVSKSAPENVTGAVAPINRDAALDGTKPILIMHRPHQRSASVPRLLAKCHAAYGEHLALGVSAPLPGLNKATHEQWNDGCGSAAVRLADPRGYILDPGLVRLGKTPVKPRHLQYAPYLNNSTAADWVAQVLDAQRVVGANLLLTPGRALDHTNPQAALDEACNIGNEALAELYTGERLGLNLTLPSEWLIRDRPREALLDQLLDQEQFDVWHIRVQWPATIRSWAQPTDEQLLRGYRRLAELALDEERCLLLPQTGTTGWLMQAFGASGFGIGLTGTDNAFKEFSMGRGGPIERYFERQLLHAVERTEHNILRQSGDYEVCTCEYCEPLRGRTTWSHELAALHYASTVASLTAGVDRSRTGRGGVHGYVRRTVRSALRFASDRTLVELNEPRHLPVWDRVL